MSEMAQENQPSNRLRPSDKDNTTLYDTVRRAFAEFLALPTWIILGFLLLAIGFYFLDRAEIAWLTPLQTILRTRVFADAQATSDLLSTIASGIITHIDVAALGAAANQQAGEVEVVLQVSIGAYLAFQDVLGTVRAQSEGAAAAMGAVVRRAIHLEGQRDITIDPAYGIEQLEMVAWTSISTAKSNPQPGLLTIRSLRDILVRWSVEEDKAAAAQPFAVVYQDNVVEHLMDTFETLAVVSSESMQHQNFIEVVHTFALMFDRLPAPWQVRVEDLILRILSALGDHVLTAQLDLALTDLIKTLTASARFETAAAVRAAQDQLRRSIGKLNSRATRVGGKG